MKKNKAGGAPAYSVVIPLYNQRGDVVRAVRSAAGQSVAPLEVIVVDDGSTDGGASLVTSLGLPLVRVVYQQNRGAAAARNRGIAESTGEYVCLLDADDWWDEDFLHHISNMIRTRPGCGVYCTGFWIHRPDGMYLNEHKVKTVGVIADYFRRAAWDNVCHTSAAVVPRAVLDRVGGFPEGMHQCEDTYFFTQVAIRYPVCYLPARMSNCNRLNPRPRLYKPGPEEYSFLDLRVEGRDEVTEYLRYCQIYRALLQSENGYTDVARQAARACSGTRRHRIGLLKLRILNGLPARWRRPLMTHYKRAAWVLLRRGIME